MLVTFTGAKNSAMWFSTAKEAYKTCEGIRRFFLKKGKKVGYTIRNEFYHKDLLVVN